jgi:hypothetical protein
VTLDTSSFLLAGAWYGVLATVSLLAFASLAYEIRVAQGDCHRADDQDAWIIVQQTLNVNFLAYLVLHVPVAFACVKLYDATGPDSRPWLCLGIVFTAGYWSYTRACEHRLLEFLLKKGIASSGRVTKRAIRAADQR